MSIQTIQILINTQQHVSKKTQEQFQSSSYTNRQNVYTTGHPVCKASTVPMLAYICIYMHPDVTAKGTMRKRMLQPTVELVCPRAPPCTMHALCECAPRLGSTSLELDPTSKMPPCPVLCSCLSCLHPDVTAKGTMRKRMLQPTVELVCPRAPPCTMHALCECAPRLGSTSLELDPTSKMPPCSMLVFAFCRYGKVCVGLYLLFVDDFCLFPNLEMLRIILYEFICQLS